MGNELNLLLVTAASIGFLHTILGPDHYLPFVMMARARSWSYTKTFWITFLCGFGHVSSSVFLGIIGISIGLAVTSIEAFESSRGDIAAWLLIAFGLVYFVWGMRKAIKNRKHTHFHKHPNGTAHSHEHTHNKEHMHIHKEERKKEITPWILFVVFLLGPCEPLIPILMYPAASNHWSAIFMVTATFGLITIATMILMTGVLLLGFKSIPQLPKIERYMHAIAGAAILLCGISIKFLGL